MRRWVGLIVVTLSCLGACATWPNVKCPKGAKFTVANHLDNIEWYAMQSQDPALKRRLLDAIHVCRKNCHRDPLVLNSHCSYVSNAFEWAVIDKLDKSLVCLEHGSRGVQCAPPTDAVLYAEVKRKARAIGVVLSSDPLWLNHRCFGPESPRVSAMLGFIIMKANTFPGNPEAGRAKDNADLCWDHHPSVAHPITEHCAHVGIAYAEASKPLPSWTIVANELDHMP
jgi:hypothetical protein